MIGQKPKHLPSLQMHPALPHPLSHAIGIITICVIKIITICIIKIITVFVLHYFHGFLLFQSYVIFSSNCPLQTCIVQSSSPCRTMRNLYLTSFLHKSKKQRYMLLVKTKRSCLSICWHFSGKVVIILLLITFILLRNIIIVLLISDLCEVISVNILHFSCKEVDNLQQLLRIAQMFGLGGHGGGVFFSKSSHVFIKILTCIYQNSYLYLSKS